MALLETQSVNATVIMPADGGTYHFPNQHCNLFASDSPLWVPAATKCVGEGNAYGGQWGAFFLQYLLGTDSFDEDDAAGTIGRGRIINPRCQITVRKIRKGIWPMTSSDYKVDCIRFLCTIEDLYDFNYEDSELASHAAAYQIGYGNGNNERTKGLIFLDRIEIDTCYESPFELEVYSPPVAPPAIMENE